MKNSTKPFRIAESGLAGNPQSQLRNPKFGHTMTLAKLRRELGVLRGGGEEHHGLPGLGSILGTED